MGPTESDRAGLSRRRWLAGVCASAWLSAGAQPTSLSPASTLAVQLGAALKRGQPLLVMVSLEGCPFCRVARESYLLPLRRERGAEIVQLDMRSLEKVTDFQGRVRTHDELVRQWGVKVAPTVLFFGPDGREVAERLVGAYIPDFYGAYLDQRLLAAQAAIQR